MKNFKHSYMKRQQRFILLLRSIILSWILSLPKRFFTRGLCASMRWWVSLFNSTKYVIDIVPEQNPPAFTCCINSAPNMLSVSLKPYACRIIQGEYLEAIQDCERGKYINVSCWLYFFHIGRLILTSLFTFVLIYTRLCVYKRKHVRYELTLSSSRARVQGEMFSSLGVIFKEMLSFRNCKICGGWQKG